MQEHRNFLHTTEIDGGVLNSAERIKFRWSSCAYARFENIVHTDRSVELNSIRSLLHSSLHYHSRTPGYSIALRIHIRGGGGANTHLPYWMGVHKKIAVTSRDIQSLRASVYHESNHFAFDTYTVAATAVGYIECVHTTLLTIAVDKCAQRV